jgi:pyrroloquinoline quinone biosynthesis protein E
MPQPCRSCSRRDTDFGGCRCQAFLLTGDAARTDPVCHLSPDHGIVAEALRTANPGASRGADAGANAGAEPAEKDLIPRALPGRRV